LELFSRTSDSVLDDELFEDWVLGVGAESSRDESSMSMRRSGMQLVDGMIGFVDSSGNVGLREDGGTDTPRAGPR
jgi:hypothetical protein